MLYLSYGKITVPKKKHFSFYPSSSISLSSILSPFCHSVFLPVPFSPFLSFLYTHSTCVQLSIFFHTRSTFCTFFPLLPSNVCFFSFFIPTSTSRHHFSFLCTLSSQVLRNFLCRIPFILPVVSGFFDSLPSVLLIWVFVPFTQLYIHPSSFCLQSFHFFSGISVPPVGFLYLVLRVLFLFSPTFR
jgi:hypothetical protein